MDDDKGSPQTQMDFLDTWGDEDANEAVGRLGELESELARQQAAMDDEVRRAKKPFEEEIDELAAKRNRTIEEIAKYVSAHRDRLTGGGKKKTVVFRNGTVRWKWTQPALEFEDGVKQETVIDRLRTLRGLRKFTRLGPRTLDKRALVKNPGFVARIAGVFIGQRENLLIKPNQLEKEVVKTGDPYRVTGNTVKKD